MRPSRWTRRVPPEAGGSDSQSIGRDWPHRRAWLSVTRVAGVRSDERGSRGKAADGGGSARRLARHRATRRATDVAAHTHTRSPPLRQSPATAVRGATQRPAGTAPRPTATATRRPRPTMLIPVRCFTCGKIIGDKWNEYLSLLEKDHTERSRCRRCRRCRGRRLIVCARARARAATRSTSSA